MSYKKNCPNCHQAFKGSEWHKANSDNTCTVVVHPLAK